MKKLIRTILIFLLLGSILNVAVAWGCALWSGSKQLYLKEASFSQVRGVQWFGDTTQNWPVTSDFPIRGERKSLGFLRRRYRYPDHDQTNDFYQTVMLIGIPMYSFFVERHEVFPSGGFGNMSWTPSNSWRDGLNFPQWLRTNPFQNSFPILPTQPIWSGFIFNTLFYATPLWLLFPGRYMLRRRRRIRRGLCGRCGYVVSVNAGVSGVSPVCTECGTPIPLPTSPDSPTLGIVRPKA